MALRDHYTLELAGSRREQRLAAGSLAEVQGAVESAEAACAARESDNRGLRRTLERIQARLGDAKEVDTCKPLAVQVQDHQDALEVEERTLQESIASIREVGGTLRKRLALEREKRLKLKASCRAKLERLGESQAALRDTVSRKQGE